MFLEEFGKYFTDAEKNTELYKIWSAIGVNMEKAIFEELEKKVAETTNIMLFSEDTMRSWLGFFLATIPNYISAQITVRVKITDFKGATSVSIPAGTQLTTDDGYIYTQTDSIVLGTSTSSARVNCIQGKLVEQTGIYNDIIRVKAINPDLSTITVKISDMNVPKTSYTNSYDSLTYLGGWNAEMNMPPLTNDNSQKGYFYVVSIPGYYNFDNVGYKQCNVGDVVLNCGESYGWQLVPSSQGLNYIQWNEQFSVPYNGYFAYYYDGYLYIKIYPGKDVAEPEGLDFSVTYYSSDGNKATVNRIYTESSDTNKVFTYVSTPKGSNDTPVEYIIYNDDKSSTGYDAVSREKLGLYLKQCLYSSSTLCTIPQYTNWIKAQPEIGDCKVVSQFELESIGISKDTGGKVLIYAMSSAGDPILPDGSISWRIEQRMAPFKDLSLLEWQEVKYNKHFIAIEYSSSSNNSLFEQYVVSTIQSFYNMNEVYGKGESCFDSLDLSKVYAEIMRNDVYSSQGLKLTGYFYDKIEIENASEDIVRIGNLPFSNVNVGDGFYVKSNSTNEILEQYDEFENTDTEFKSADIYKVNQQNLVPSYPATRLGNITDRGDMIDLSIFTSTMGLNVGDYLMAFMKPKQTNIIPSQEFYYRQLAGYSIKNTSMLAPDYHFF